MEINEYRFDYSKQKEFLFLLSGDSHCDDPKFDSEAFHKDHQLAIEKGAWIIEGGDWARCIVPSDTKRYSAGQERRNMTAYSNSLIREATQIYKPYANRILQIGNGNHVTAYQKHHDIDLTAFLLAELNKDLERYIVHGGYRGYIRLKFHHGSNSAVRTFDIFYWHGIGGQAEISKGTITLDRLSYYRADLIWIEHIHKKTLDANLIEKGLTRDCRLYEKARMGVVTGCYLRDEVLDNDITKQGYVIDYGEEKQRRPQGKGGAWLRIWITGHDMDLRWEITFREDKPERIGNKEARVIEVI